jgi:hypothetical protein
MVHENDFGGVLALGKLQWCTLKEQTRGAVLTQISSNSPPVQKHRNGWEGGTQSESVKQLRSPLAPTLYPWQEGSFLALQQPLRLQAVVPHARAKQV